MPHIDFHAAVKAAWSAYDSSREIKYITDISARVSTNHVFRIKFADDTVVIAKLSFFGHYEHFVEDHTIINSLSNNLPEPYHHFLARSLMKGNELFVHRIQNDLSDIWVVFYRPIGIQEKLPARLDKTLIKQLAKEFALFHKACTNIRNTLPPSSKSMRSDLEELLAYIETDEGHFEHGFVKDQIQTHCNRFLDQYDNTSEDHFPIIPVFVDWNIGNFSVTQETKLYSRWDYDWFRMSTRMIDFYFFARIVSDVGDRTVFTYNIDVLKEDRFVYFLQEYHKVFPLSVEEIQLLPEMYRFFLLNYVVKYGHYFFHQVYANKLKVEVFQTHLPSIATFDVSILKTALSL